MTSPLGESSRRILLKTRLPRSAAILHAAAKERWRTVFSGLSRRPGRGWTTRAPALVRYRSLAIDYVLAQTSRWLVSRQPPSAIIAGGGRALAGVLQAICAAGRCVPDDISVISVGDTDLAEWPIHLSASQAGISPRLAARWQRRFWRGWRTVQRPHAKPCYRASLCCADPVPRCVMWMVGPTRNSRQSAPATVVAAVG